MIVFIIINSVLLLIILNQLSTMANELDELKANVEKNAEVDQSAIVLLNGLKQKLDAAIAGGDMGAVKILSDQIGNSTQALADAVAANTPAE